MLAHDALDSVAAEPLVTIADEERIFLRAAALGEPVAQDLHAVLADQRCAFLAPLAHASDVSARTEHDITTRQVDQLRDAEPSLQGERQQRTITTATPRRQIWRGDHCLYLGARQIGDGPFLMPFRGHREHALAMMQELRLVHSHIL